MLLPHSIYSGFYTKKIFFSSSNVFYVVAKHKTYINSILYIAAEKIFLFLYHDKIYHLKKQKRKKICKDEEKLKNHRKQLTQKKKKSVFITRPLFLLLLSYYKKEEKCSYIQFLHKKTFFFAIGSFGKWIFPSAWRIDRLGRYFSSSSFCLLCWGKILL